MINKVFLLFLAFAVIPGPALAASQTVTLDVKKMTCAVCPITVKKSLERVSGVQQIKVDYASKTVTVQFDDTVATPDKLTKATKDAGYPSTVKGDYK
jgi:mercuric ion binding protein